MGIFGQARVEAGEEPVVVRLSGARARLAEISPNGSHRSISIIGTDPAGRDRVVPVTYPDRSHARAAVLADEINRTGSATVISLSEAVGAPYATDSVRSGEVALERRDLSDSAVKDLVTALSRMVRGRGPALEASDAIAAHRAGMREGR